MVDFNTHLQHTHSVEHDVADALIVTVQVRVALSLPGSHKHMCNKTTQYGKVCGVHLYGPHVQTRLDLLEEGAVEVVDVVETREKQFAQVVGHEIVAVDGVAKPLRWRNTFNDENTSRRVFDIQCSLTTVSTSRSFLYVLSVIRSSFAM